SQLHQLIYYHLDNEMLDTANFLAGRLHALEPKNPDSSHLLALSYLRLRRFKAAYDFSQRYGANGRHLGCAFVFANACLDIGRYPEGCAALEKAKSLWHGKVNWKKHSETTRRHLPDAPAVYTVMAKLWQAHGDLRKAGDCFIEAHKSSPFTWEAFEGLCKIGADLNLANMFRTPADMVAAAAQVLTPSADLFNTSHVVNEAGRFAIPHANTRLRQPLMDWDTPTAHGSEISSEDVAMGGASARPRPTALRSHAYSSSETTVVEDPRKPSIGGHKRTISGQVPQSTSVVDLSAQPRRSNRLFGQGVSSRAARSGVEGAPTAGRDDREARAPKAATGVKGRTTSTVGRVVSGNRKMLPPDPANKEKERRAPSRNSEKNAPAAPGVTAAVVPKPQQPTVPAGSDAQIEQQAMVALLDNMRQLAVGCHANAVFELPQAIQLFKSLPSAQRDTPWVLAQLGKAYYEQADYKSAEDCFARLLKLQPSRIEDMEVYSTVLWHLKGDSSLAHLCHLLRDQNFHAPQTWCAVGNAFSLAREHDQAIAAFKRATQLDESFAYAWTLIGHEYVANEEFDAALSSFRKSVAVDRRCYGGWYGLGKSYERMGKLEEAERHYRIAASINPSNPTLLVCIGVVLERLHSRKAALANYTRALEIAPSSALARFKKARVLMHMRYFSEALVELELLRDQAPDEANVWFLLGKCYKGLGDKSEALRALTTALNLDVKAAPFIKEAMEALDDDDE
ncbi:hypothetical protein BAUCODRAFT_59879, partial [Baudoinia panamericana UAMH 10762]